LNFGRDGNIEHGIRYERAAEFLDVVFRLWDSWQDDAILLDRSSGIFADPSRIHRLDHDGKHLKVRGPLNVPRPPQGHPVIVQAGSSEDGKNLAAAYADIHFAIIRSVEDGQRYRQDFNTRLARYGRAPESAKILPGILPVVAGSRAEATEKQEFLETLVPVRMSVDLLSSWCGVDLSSFPLDGPMPPLPEDATFDGGRTFLARVKALAVQDLSIREIAHRLTNSGAIPTMAGTAQDVADQMEAWFTAGAADGYNLMFPLLPEDWTNFMQTVVPELQRRGLARTEYGEGTFRDRLGLARPPNRFVAS
jgi:FMN-dependent oxidoreductase (nitrilotriacetate monooxygenase family)